MTMRTTFSLAALLMLGGCVSMGTNYDPTAITQLQPGMTIDQVVARLGKPNSVAVGPDGTQRLMWVHSTGSMFGAEARSVLLEFGADGRFIRTLSQAATQMH